MLTPACALRLLELGPPLPRILFQDVGQGDVPISSGGTAMTTATHTQDECGGAQTCPSRETGIQKNKSYALLIMKQGMWT